MVELKREEPEEQEPEEVSRAVVQDVDREVALPRRWPELVAEELERRDGGF